MARRKTHDEFVQEVYQINPHVKVLDKYINSSTKITFYCEKDDYTWEMKPNHFLTRGGCPVCNGTRYNTKSFREKATQLNPNVIVLGEYNGFETKTEIKCIKCGYEWKSTPANIFKGKSCPKCNNCYKDTHDEFVEKLNKKYNGEYIVIGDYENSHTKIRLKHLVCGTEFDATPNRILSEKDPRRCPICYGGIKMTDEDFTYRVKELCDDEYIFLEEYQNSLTKIKCKHNICGHVYSVMPNDFLNGCRRCPKCNGSKGEIRCQKYFDAHNIRYESYKEYDGLVGLKNGLLSYDFYLPDYNILLEYQGEFHDGKANEYVARNIDVQQEHDRRKRQYAIDHNIELMEIWYWDFDNIEKILYDRLGV